MCVWKGDWAGVGLAPDEHPAVAGIQAETAQPPPEAAVAVILVGVVRAKAERFARGAAGRDALHFLLGVGVGLKGIDILAEIGLGDDGEIGQLQFIARLHPFLLRPVFVERHVGDDVLEKMLELLPLEVQELVAGHAIDGHALRPIIKGIGMGPAIFDVGSPA